ncbi:Uncharacterised protein [Mycobacterium tuberculosis]|nr:Uncharacterised protein [Mycobacterium tuberculosis]
MLTIPPPPRSSMRGIAYFIAATYPRRFTVITRSHTSKSMSTTSVSARIVLMSAPTLNNRSTPP